MRTQREFHFGEGKISGAVSATLGVLGLGAVLCLMYPGILTTPDLREVYPMAWVRGLIQLALVVAFTLGVLNLVLGWRRVYGFLGIGCSVLAMLLGGAQAEMRSAASPRGYVGLDWFILNLFFLALVFVPLERLFGRRFQKVFREGWKTDLSHFFVSHVAVQMSVLLTMVPAALLFRGFLDEGLQRAVAGQPIWLQSLEALVVADLFAYFSHRLFHAVPLLWRFHQIHHSCEVLDWLASSRLHIVDIVVTRAVAFVPLYVLGFSTAAVYPYLVFASLQGILIHANLGWRFGPIRHLLVTPQFHHWHHTADPRAVDKNFAIHLPVIDWLFGTHYLPRDQWPTSYGLAGGPAIPRNYLSHLLYPFRRQRAG